MKIENLFRGEAKLNKRERDVTLAFNKIHLLAKGKRINYDGGSIYENFENSKRNSK
jgi:hypothetical protein